ncbi:hypothetical protein SMICM17S_06186 [Streptomyces microflavus]
MIEEYARHNGHADLIRERIDGVDRRLTAPAARPAVLRGRAVAPC